ncbi:hypothetical protein MMC06_005623 [Schaereria dolodes]|nr:hypothetical protein [Schaereria dolodes]
MARHCILQDNCIPPQLNANFTLEKPKYHSKAKAASAKPAAPTSRPIAFAAAAEVAVVEAEAGALVAEVGVPDVNHIAFGLHKTLSSPAAALEEADPDTMLEEPEPPATPVSILDALLEAAVEPKAAAAALLPVDATVLADVGPEEAAQDAWLGSTTFALKR